MENVSKLTNPIKLSKLKPKPEDEIEEEVKAPVKKGKVKAKKVADETFEEDQDEDDQLTKTKKKTKVSKEMKTNERRRRKLRQDTLDIENDDDHNGKIEVVPQLRYDDYDVDALAEMRVLAQKMLRKKDREGIIDDSYNRYSRPVDEDAPDWFLEDEAKHSHKIMPITKEEFAIEKARLYELKNKPIKKVFLLIFYRLFNCILGS